MSIRSSYILPALRRFAGELQPVRHQDSWRRRLDHVQSSGAFNIYFHPARRPRRPGIRQPSSSSGAATDARRADFWYDSAGAALCHHGEGGARRRHDSRVDIAAWLLAALGKAEAQASRAAASAGGRRGWRLVRADIFTNIGALAAKPAVEWRRRRHARRARRGRQFYGVVDVRRAVVICRRRNDRRQYWRHQALVYYGKRTKMDRPLPRGTMAEKGDYFAGVL